MVLKKKNPYLNDNEKIKDKRKEKAYRYREYETTAIQLFWNSLIAFHGIIIGIVAIIATLDNTRVSSAMLATIFITAIISIFTLMVISVMASDLNSFRAFYFEITSGFIEEIPGNFNKTEYDEKYKSKYRNYRICMKMGNVIAFFLQVTNCVFLYLIIQNSSPF
ncbi:MAG: hypothetical protein WC449_06000 [Candidatus Paceibacterota bacterium]